MNRPKQRPGLRTYAEADIAALFADWMDAKRYMIWEVSSSIERDWQQFLSESARVRARSLGVEWQSDWDHA